MPLVHGAGGNAARSVQLVGVRGQRGDALLHALELRDGNIELMTAARIGAGGRQRQAGPGGRLRRQRDAAADRQRRHQHHPALPGIFLAADNPVQRHEDVLSFQRSVLERLPRGEMPLAVGHARRVGRDQRQRDADILLVAQQAVRVLQLEGDAHDGRDGAERDIALVEIQADSQRFLAVHRCFLDNADRFHGPGVGAGGGFGQTETGNFLAPGQPRQPVILLLVRAEMHQQFARAERVRNHDADRARAAARGQLADHLRMTERGKAQTAIFLRNDHPEKFVLTNEIPDFRRQVLALVLDLPRVEHIAQLFDGAVDEGLLGFGQRVAGRFAQHAPVRIAGKNLGVEPQSARLQRRLFRLGNLGQRVAGELVEGFGDRVGHGVSPVSQS